MQSIAIDPQTIILGKLTNTMITSCIMSLKAQIQYEMIEDN